MLMSTVWLVGPKCDGIGYMYFPTDPQALTILTIFKV